MAEQMYKKAKAKIKRLSFRVIFGKKVLSDPSRL